jgi:hypothetical protein
VKTEVFSWRLSTALKSQLEREARLRKTSVAALLDDAARTLLARDNGDLNEEDEQTRLRQAAEKWIGSVELPWTNASGRVSEIVRDKLRARRAQ